MARKVAVKEDLLSELTAQTSFDEVWLNLFCFNVPQQEDLLLLSERHPKTLDISISWIHDFIFPDILPENTGNLGRIELRICFFA